MSALVRALHETNMVAIVRYVWRNNGNPKLAFLSPCIKKDYEVKLKFIFSIKTNFSNL